jgi:hypothetical protein
MKKKLLWLLLSLPGLLGAQQRPAERFKPAHTVFAGLQLPLNYVAGYRLQFSRRLSAQLQGGLIAAPFDRYTLKTMNAFGLDPQLSRALGQAIRQGNSVSAGLTIHATSPWYAGVFGQFVHLVAGPITPADALGVYFQRDFSGFGLGNAPAFVFTMQSSLWMGGVRVGHSFRFGQSRFGLNVEASVGKILATRNVFSSNRPFIDGLGVTQRLYGNLNREIDGKLRQHGYLPTLNLLLSYHL